MRRPGSGTAATPVDDQRNPASASVGGDPGPSGGAVETAVGGGRHLHPTEADDELMKEFEALRDRYAAVLRSLGHGRLVSIAPQEHDESLDALHGLSLRAHGLDEVRRASWESAPRFGRGFEVGQGLNQGLFPFRICPRVTHDLTLRRVSLRGCHIGGGRCCRSMANQ